MAGVSIDYVIRLEQARGLRPSADVVEALATALRLEPAERLYLFDLAQQRPRRADTGATVADPALAGLVEDLSPFPAMLMNSRFDILAWNSGMARLLLDFSEVPDHERNAMWLCLAHPAIRDLYDDRDQVIRDGVAHLRAAWATHPDDAALTALIEKCLAADDQIAELWTRPDIDVKGRGRKVLRHPEVGVITTDFEVLIPVESPDLRLLLFRAADQASRSSLERILAH